MWSWWFITRDTLDTISLGPLNLLFQFNLFVCVYACVLGVCWMGGGQRTDNLWELIRPLCLVRPIPGLSSSSRAASLLTFWPSLHGYS